MIIRTLIQEDLPKLRDISRAAVLESVDAPQTAKQEILEGIFNNLERVSSGSTPGSFLIAEFDDVPAGFILIKNYWNLSDLFVLPDYHGKGIGQALWSAALPSCEKFSDRNSIRVNSSLNAVAFYESLGFRKMAATSDLPDWILPLERLFATRS